MTSLTAPRNVTEKGIALVLPCLGEEFGRHSEKGKQNEKLLQTGCSLCSPARPCPRPWALRSRLQPAVRASGSIPPNGSGPAALISPGRSLAQLPRLVGVRAPSPGAGRPCGGNIPGRREGERKGEGGRGKEAIPPLGVCS